MVSSEWTRARSALRWQVSRPITIHRSPLTPSGQSAEDEERLAVLHRLAILHEDGLDPAVLVGLDLVEQLHGLDDAQRVARLDRLPHFDEGFRAGRGGAVERADHGGADDV